MTPRLKDFGSYVVGGRLHRVTEGAPRRVQVTRHAAYDVDPRGHFAIGQTYVQYFVPAARRDAPPVVLVHGGGMHGGTWETTPDGRPGWLHLLLGRGFEVHVPDLVERGRSGFAAGIWTEAPILRSAEEVWTLFRFGAARDFADRKPFAGQQFPVACLEDLARRQVPRWLGNTALQTEGLLAVLARTGPATVICHSQGAEVVFDALARQPALVCGILAVEPSGMPRRLEDLDRCRLTIMAGDHLDCAPHWQALARGWRALVDDLTARGGEARHLDTVAEVAPGGSHMLMMDRHMADCLDAGLAGHF